ncbi:MAG: GDSL-type esterase/lipase family protein [Planctomycetota bacterium]|nr:GDSL-type esterase/lipase family protein [Planctomycetota bacterium]
MITQLLITILISQLGDGSSTVPTKRDGWHQERHNAINKVVEANQGKVDVVFIGDSITQGWEGAGAKAWEESFDSFRPVNLGISGDRTEHLLWRFDNGNLEGIAPKVAVIMIGTNNFGYRQDTPEEVYDGVVAVVEKLQEIEPKMQVLLLDIFPRGAKFNQMRGELLQVNQALQATYNDDEDVTFYPIGHHFLEDDGTISKEVMPDELHLSEKGYKIWADAVAPRIARMLGRSTRGAPPRPRQPLRR